MVGRPGVARRLARHAGALLAAAGRLLLAAGDRRAGCGAEAGGLLVQSSSFSLRSFRRRTCPPISNNAGQVRLLNKVRRETKMPKYVIEREIPGAGNMSPQELQAASQK